MRIQVGDKDPRHSPDASQERVRTTLACHTVTSGIQKRIQFLQEQQWRKDEREAFKQPRVHHPLPRPSIFPDDPKKFSVETKPDGGRAETLDANMEVSPAGEAALLQENVDDENQDQDKMPSAPTDVTVPEKSELPLRRPFPVGLLPLGTFAEVLASRIKEEDEDSGTADEPDREETLPPPLPVGLLPVGTVLPPGPTSRTTRGREGRKEVRCTLAKPLTTEYSVVSGALQIRWTADARWLSAVSPPFELSYGLGHPVAQFKLVLTPSTEENAALLGQRVLGCVQVKCLTTGLPDSLPHVRLRLSVGGSDARSVSHNFGQCATCDFRADQDEWDFAPWIDPLTLTAVILLEILPHHFT